MFKLKKLFGHHSVKSSMLLYIALIVIEIAMAVFLWWYFIWGWGQKLIFAAVTVVGALFCVNLNNAIVVWLMNFADNRRRKQELKKTAARKPDDNANSSRFRRHH